jgi:hypothetical protein
VGNASRYILWRISGGSFGNDSKPLREVIALHLRRVAADAEVRRGLCCAWCWNWRMKCEMEVGKVNIEDVG